VEVLKDWRTFSHHQQQQTLLLTRSATAAAKLRMMLYLQFQQTIGGLARYQVVLEAECAEVAHRSSSQGKMHVGESSLGQQGQCRKCAVGQMYKQQEQLQVSQQQQLMFQQQVRQ
jgi:hypothetical protein